MLEPDKILKNLDKLGIKEVVEQLHKLYSLSNENEIRIRILQILNELKDDSHFEEIENYFLSDEDNQVRMEAAKILAFHYKKSKVLDPLIWVLENEPTNVIKYTALKLLVALGHREKDLKVVVESLKKDLRSDDDNLKINAAESLGILEEQTALEGLIDTLNAYNKEVRIRAIQALGLLKNSKAIHHLTPHLASISYDVWKTTLDALKMILGDKTIDLLINIIETTDDSVDGGFIRFGTIKALKYIRDKRAIPILIDMLDDYFYWTRWEAAKALDEIEPNWKELYFKKIEG